MENKVSKAELARRLGVSRASLYYEHKRPNADEELRQAIEAVMLRHPGYGHRRVADALKINRKRAQRVMALFNLKPARRCRTPHKQDDVGRAEANFSDITRGFCPIVPNALWVSDFTFISYRGKVIFLATILDRFTAEVLGANVLTSHTAELPLIALRRALLQADILPLWCHSDQGSEYNSDVFLSELAKHNIQVSMSPKASPWRNGAQESFFGRFKIEFGDPDRFETLPELIEAIYAFIYYYNHERIHTRLRMPPVEFKKLWLDNQQKLTSYKQVMSLPLGEPPQHTDNYFEYPHDTLTSFNTTTNFNIYFEEWVSKERGT